MIRRRDLVLGLAALGLSATPAFAEPDVPAVISTDLFDSITSLTKSHYALWLKATDGARFFGC